MIYDCRPSTWTRFIAATGCDPRATRVGMKLVHGKIVAEVLQPVKWGEKLSPITGYDAWKQSQQAILRAARNQLGDDHD